VSPVERAEAFRLASATVLDPRPVRCFRAVVPFVLHAPPNLPACRVSPERDEAQDERGPRAGLAGLLALLLAACGGPPFTADLFTGQPLDAAEAGQDAPVSSSEGGQDFPDAGSPLDAFADVPGLDVAVHDAAPEASSGDGCTWTTHTNGLGGSWDDCAPLGTYDQGEAMAACAAHAGASSCTADEDSVTDSDPGTACGPHAWVYSGAQAGRVVDCSNPPPVWK
jgi:hypothetical protein